MTQFREEYSFQFTVEETREIEKVQRAQVVRRPLGGLLFAVAYFVLTLIINDKGSYDMVVGMALALLLAAIFSLINSLLFCKKFLQRQMEKIPRSVYSYRFYPDHFIADCFRDGVRKSSRHITYGDITNLQVLPDLYLIVVDRDLFILRRRDLQELSYLYAFMGHNPQKVKHGTTLDRWQIGSAVLLAASVLAFCLGVLLLDRFTMPHLMPKFWVLYLLTPIPLASLIFGIIGKVKGHSLCTKNIVIGIIITLSLCFYGSFSFIFG